MARQAGNRKTGNKEAGDSGESHQASDEGVGQPNNQEENPALVPLAQDLETSDSTAGVSNAGNTSSHPSPSLTLPSGPTQNPIRQVFETLGVTSTGRGMYQASPNVPSQELFHGLLAHLLQAHGGPYSTNYPENFTQAVEEFKMANVATLARIGEHPVGQRVPGMDSRNQEQGNTLEENAARAIGQILDILSLTLSVYYKYRFLRTSPPSDNEISVAPSIDSAFAESQSPANNQPTSSAEAAAAPSGEQPAPPSNAVEPRASNQVEWTAETYYSNPAPQNLEQQILRYANHPSFQYPVNSALNWEFRGIESSRGSSLTPTGWIPPTSCPRYRQYLAHELYHALNEWSEVGLDAGGTRVFKAWKALHDSSPEEFWRVAWRIVAKIHKLHMHQEEIRGMGFLVRVDYVRDLFRRAKGSCLLASKEGCLKVYISDPVGKKKTFGYNQSSNARKKQRDADHVGLHMQVHGQDPPWKVAKKRLNNGEDTAQASGRVGTAPPATGEPQQTQPLLLLRSGAAQRDTQVAAQSRALEGADAEGEGPSAARKRKRGPTTASKSKGKGKAKATAENEGDEESRKDPKQTKKSKSTPALGPTIHRNIAPKPVPVQEPQLESPNMQPDVQPNVQSGNEPNSQALNRFTSLSASPHGVPVSIPFVIPGQVNLNITASNLNSEGQYTFPVSFGPFPPPSFSFVTGHDPCAPFIEFGQAGPSNYGQSDINEQLGPFDPARLFSINNAQQEDYGLPGMFDQIPAAQAGFMLPPAPPDTTQGYPVQEDMGRRMELEYNFPSAPNWPQVTMRVFSLSPGVMQGLPGTMQGVPADSQFNTAQYSLEELRPDMPYYSDQDLGGNLLPRDLHTVGQHALDAVEYYAAEQSMLNFQQGPEDNNFDMVDLMEQYIYGMDFEENEDGEFQY